MSNVLAIAAAAGARRFLRLALVAALDTDL